MALVWLRPKQHAFKQRSGIQWLCSSRGLRQGECTYGAWASMVFAGWAARLPRRHCGRWSPLFPGFLSAAFVNVGCALAWLRLKQRRTSVTIVMRTSN
jgi:hypothetical protein